MSDAPQEREARAARPGRRGILSRLTLRILAINLFAVAILFVGVLYLDRYQNSLIRAELEAIDRQGRVFAQAVGELAIPSALGGPSRLSPPALRRLVRRLAPALDMRVRIFAPGGRLLVDSAVLPGPGGFIRMHPLPPPRDGGVVAQMLFDMAQRMADWLPRRGDMPPYRERAEQWADDYLEVRLALAGETAQQVRLTSDGALLLSVAVPVQSYKEVLGALMLSTEGRDIDDAVRDVRLEILGVFAIVFTITVLLSLYLAGTIIRPVQRLARAAEDVRAGGRRRGEIPNLGARGDEIGDLSMALRDMTEALRDRVDAIERFAADVAHEIKNPLTSLRSAVETAARIEDPAQRAKLMTIILD
ncbi:MAG: stimulus-sensing domain-containing protein, partial [Thalassobaculaceae bacterium]